ncbi:MAG TPA: Patatin, partial [Pararhizobium sp.]|nr:Patatin [Pararhizobium sp.]
DISLLPRLSDVGLSEFYRAGEAIERGYEAAHAQINEVKRLQEVVRS